MGCTKSKLDENVCLKDEKPSMHSKFIKEQGIKRYYQVMGMPENVPIAAPGAETDDKSSNLNLGFINISEKSTTENLKNFYGLSMGDVLEVSIGFCLFLYLLRIIYKLVMKRRKKAKQSKSMEMREIIQSANETSEQKTHFQLHQQTPKTIKTPMDYAIATIHQQPRTMLPMFTENQYQID